MRRYLQTQGSRWKCITGSSKRKSYGHLKRDTGENREIFIQEVGPGLSLSKHVRFSCERMGRESVRGWGGPG